MCSKTLTLAVMLALCPAHPLTAQRPGSSTAALTVQVEAELQVGGDRRLAYSEPHLAVDPRDPDHWVVVSIVGFTRRQDNRQWGCAVMVTRDGGRSWSESGLELERCADPWVVVNGRNAWFASLHDGARGRQLAVYRSADGGASWTDPVVVGRGHDHPTLVASGVGGVYAVSAYLTVRGSERRSHAFVLPVDVPGTPAEPIAYPLPHISNTLEPVLLDDDALLIPMVGFSEFVGDRQVRITPPRTGAVRVDLDRRDAAGPHPMTRRCGSGKGFAGSAVDRSGGRFDGRIYVACVSLRGGDVLVVHSDDGGRSWGEPVPVLNEREPRVEDPALRRSAGIAVNQRGVIGVVWQDRSGSRQRRCQVQRFAASGDGGASFSPPVSLSSEPSCPDNRANAEAARQWPAGSDYGVVVALPNGRFVSTWADARNEAYKVWMATVRVL